MKINLSLIRNRLTFRPLNVGILVTCLRVDVGLYGVLVVVEPHIKINFVTYSPAQHGSMVHTLNHDIDEADKGKV